MTLPLPPVLYEMGNPPPQSNNHPQIPSSDPATSQYGESWLSNFRRKWRESPRGWPGSEGSSHSVFEYYRLRYDEEVRYVLRYSNDGVHLLIPLSPAIPWMFLTERDLPEAVARAVDRCMWSTRPAVECPSKRSLACTPLEGVQEIRRMGKEILWNAVAEDAVEALLKSKSKFKGRWDLYTSSQVESSRGRTDEQVVASLRLRLGVDAPAPRQISKGWVLVLND